MLPCLTYEKKQFLLSNTLLKELPENKFFEVKKSIISQQGFQGEGVVKKSRVPPAKRQCIRKRL